MSEENAENAKARHERLAEESNARKRERRTEHNQTPDSDEERYRKAKQEQEDLLKAKAQAEEKTRKEREKDGEQQQENARKNAETPEEEEQTVRLTQEEQKLLQERVMGMKNKLFGEGVKIQLIDGSTIKQEPIMVNGQTREFIGYKNRWARMTEDRALAIVLRAKESGWTAMHVSGTRKAKDMLTRVAAEHGLNVTNHIVHNKPETKFGAGGMKSDTVEQFKKSQGNDNTSSFTKTPEAANAKTRYGAKEKAPQKQDVKKVSQQKRQKRLTHQ